MSLSKFSSSAIAAAIVLTLGACSSSSDDNNTPASGPGEQPTDMNPDPITTPDPVTTPDPATPQVPTPLFGPAQYIVSDCGSLDVSTAISTNSLTAPTPMTVGEPVRGQLVPNSVDQNFHTWQVTLEPGNYHLVADASTLKERGTDAMGLEFTSLGATTEDNERLFYETTADFSMRIYEYLEIQAAQIMTIKVEAVYDRIHNYTFGIFRNGTAVPSPSIENCLPINTLSVGSPQSVVMDAADTRADDRWYRIDLESRQYQLDASIRSAEESALGYSFELFTQFGQSDGKERIIYETAAGTELITSDKFEAALGHAWIRLRLVYNSTRTVEFTVSAP